MYKNYDITSDFIRRTSASSPRTRYEIRFKRLYDFMWRDFLLFNQVVCAEYISKKYDFDWTFVHNNFREKL